MSFYDRLGALAGRMIDKFGGNAQLERETRAFNATTGAVSKSQTLKATRVVISTRTVRDDRGELVSQTVATLTDAPQVNDGLTIGSKRYTIAEVEIVDPTGAQALVYRAVLK